MVRERDAHSPRQDRQALHPDTARAAVASSATGRPRRPEQPDQNRATFRRTDVASSRHEGRSQLDDLIAGRLAVGERKEQLLRRLSGANIATQRLVAPGILVMDSKVACISTNPAFPGAPRRRASPVEEGSTQGVVG